MLEAHAWPGNVRELRNAVARLVVLADLGELSLLASKPAPSAEVDPPRCSRSAPRGEGRSAERFEERYLREALAGRGTARAADAMDVTRQMVYKLMERYGVERTDR
ncbi:MAG: hypothetical protein U0359_03370 [Byssovorax sp.]